MQHHRSPVRRLALSLSSALGLAACGSSATQTGPGNAPAATATTTQPSAAPAPASTIAQSAAEPAAMSGRVPRAAASAGSGAAVQSAPASMPANPVASGAGCSPLNAGATSTRAGGPAAAGSGAAGSASASPVSAAGSGGCTPPRAAAPGTREITLTPADARPLADGSFAFPPGAVPPANESPGFRFADVPPNARSLALVFRDVSSATPPVKWILWDIAPSVSEVPANLGASPHPAQVPGSSQLGSLGNQGYAGPCCQDHVYEWILYALDVASLPGTERLSTAQIRMDLLPEHDLAQSKPLMMRIMP